MEGAALPICSPFGLSVAMLVFRLALLLYNTKCCGVLMRALTHIHQAKQPSYVVLFFFLSFQVKTSSTTVSRRETCISQLSCLRAWCGSTAGLHGTETGGKRATETTDFLHSHW